jgi:hypothetical protein
MNTEEAKTIAIGLKGSWEEISECWDITKHYDTTGLIVQKSKPLKLEIKSSENLLKKLQNLRTYVTPSYLKRIAIARRSEFEANTRAEIKHYENLINEQDE